MAFVYRKSLRRSFRRRHDSDDENIQIDFDKSPFELLREILSHIVKRDGISKGRKLGYLNCFVKFCNHFDKETDFGMSREEIFSCLRVALFHEAAEVRAAGLRAMRYLLRDKSCVEAMINIQLQLLIARSLDIILDNRIERVHALRLVRKALCVDPHNFPRALLHCLIAIATDGTKERDILVKACLGTLSDLVILNPMICIEAEVITVLLKGMLECQQPQMIEAMMGVVLFLVNNPITRHTIGPKLCIELVMAPLTDHHYRHYGDVDHNFNDDQESRFAASRVAITSILRSIPGIVYLCQQKCSTLQTLIDVLYMPYTDIRNNVIDLLYDLFCLPIPCWTGDFSVALASTVPSSMQESWQLYEDFVAAEGKAILQHISQYRTNLVKNYFALLLMVFVNLGILEALVDVITTSDEDNMFVKATLLLGELQHMANELLPSDLSHHCQCLPTLMAVATSLESPTHNRNRARRAISCLDHLHQSKKRAPVACSLFLGQLLQFSSAFGRTSGFVGIVISQNRLRQYLKKDMDDVVFHAVKDTQVLTMKYASWDWDLIGSILKWPGETMKKLEDNTCRNFIKRLMQFYKPTSKQFSVIENERAGSRKMCIVGCYLIDFLLEADEMKAHDFLDELLTDVNLCLSQVIIENAPLNATLSPTRVVNTLSQMYFLFIGRLTNSSKGKKYLEKSGLFQHMFDLVGLAGQDTYVKLVISSLDYTTDGFCRCLLTKVLTATSDAARLYATNFLRVLLRAQLPDFRKWAIELLVTQVYDKSQAVSLAATDILNEAVENKDNLESLISLKPSFLHLGDRGLLVLLHFLSSPNGFRFLRDANFLGHEMERWKRVYNLKYVRIVEDMLNDSISLHQREEDGMYGRRSSSVRHMLRNAFVPPHMYGSLAQHCGGMEMLLQENCLDPQCEVIRCPDFSSDSAILHLKAALWAIGHIGTSHLGFPHIQDVISSIITIASESPVYSVRGTCFYVLGLLSSTPDGATTLTQHGWEAVRHSHVEKWPLVLPSATLSEHLNEEQQLRSHSWSISSMGSHISDWLTHGLMRDRQRADSESSYVLPIDVDLAKSDDTQSYKSEEDNFYGGATSVSRIQTLPRNIKLLLHPSTSVEDRRPRSASDGRPEPTPQRPNSLLGVSSLTVDENLLEHASVLTDVLSDSLTSSRDSGTGEDAMAKSVNTVESKEGNKIGSELLTVGDSIDSTATKSRSGSTTDSTTSGVSSCDSNPNRTSHMEHSQTLSPIPSSTSLNTMVSRGNSITESMGQQSTSNHRLSLHSPVSPVDLPVTYSFTSARDALGYATLRAIQRRRVHSVGPSDRIFSSLDNQRFTKTRSFDPQNEASFYIGDKEFNDWNEKGNATSRRSSVYSQSDSRRSSDTIPVEQTRYIGLSLPMHLNLLCSPEVKEEGAKGQTTVLEVANTKDDGLELHCQDNCLSCSLWRTRCHANSDATPCEEKNHSGESSQNAINPLLKIKLKDSNGTFLSRNNGSQDAASKRRPSEDSATGRVLIRKEVLTLVSHLCSSIGVKAAEQGLLSLKQKFPSAFQDICLYSEVCLQMARYRFRLTARRFLQELFLDLSFDLLWLEAERLLNMQPIITLPHAEESET